MSSSTGKAQQIKTTHVPAILNHTRHVISQQVPQIQPKTVIVSRSKPPLILANTNKVNTPRATVIYAGSRPISPETIKIPQSTSHVTRIVTSASTPAKTFPQQTFKIPSPPPRKTFVNIVSSKPTHTSSNTVESRLQQQTPVRPARPGTPAPWSSAADEDIWSRPCTPRPPSSFRVPRTRWPAVDPSYEAPKLPSPEKPKAVASYPTDSDSDAPHVVNTTDDNGNIIKQEIKPEYISEENFDSIPISVVLAPLKRPLSEQNNGAKKRTKISIAQDNKLGPVKEHVNTVFEHYGVTTSFSPNMEKLIEITGTTALNYLLYLEWCKKKGMRTVNQETYGRLFRNEFKKLVGTR